MVCKEKKAKCGILSTRVLKRKAKEDHERHDAEEIQGNFKEDVKCCTKTNNIRPEKLDLAIRKIMTNMCIYRGEVLQQGRSHFMVG